MATRAVMREDGVLKLVHLGGYVELYWEPITAHVVMEKNPHHSVTRPDFWRYPWIVIQPESVLTPGSIFYIIPNHVISDLIKAYRLRNQLSSRKHHNQHPRQSPQFEAGAEMNPIHRDHSRFHLKQPPVEARAKMAATQVVSPRRVEMNHEQHSSLRYLMQKIRSMSRAKMRDAGQEPDRFLKEFPFDSCCELVPEHGKGDRRLKLSPDCSSWVESWLDLTSKQQHLHHGFKAESLDDSWLEVRPPPLPSEYDFGGEIPTKQGPINFESCHQVQAMKPCLRSQSGREFGKCCDQIQARKSCLRTQSENFGRKLDGRRVTFILPGKEQKERKFLNS